MMIHDVPWCSMVFHNLLFLLFLLCLLFFLSFFLLFSFCRSVPPEFLRSFLAPQSCALSRLAFRDPAPKRAILIRRPFLQDTYLLFIVSDHQRIVNAVFNPLPGLGKSAESCALLSPPAPSGLTTLQMADFARSNQTVTSVLIQCLELLSLERRDVWNEHKNEIYSTVWLPLNKETKIFSDIFHMKIQWMAQRHWTDRNHFRIGPPCRRSS